MIHKRRIQALGLACLVGLMSLGPAAESLAAVSWTKNNGVYVGSDGTSIAGVVARGIDVSHWKQTIDWNAVVNDDIQFVMLGTRYDNAVDPYFKTNADAAAAAGLKVGAYIYSYATTTDMAVQEANFVLDLIKDYPISYPVVFDVEASVMSTLTPAQLSDIINAFCKTVKEAGYYPMLYANDYWLTNKIDMSKVTYDVWVARYETKHTYNKAAMWQATNQGTVAGISGNVDINFAYKDFSAVIPSKQWRQINDNWYYYSDYKKQTGWINDGNGWYYMKDDGTQHKGWLHIDDKYYYLNDNTGKMITGWRKDPSTSKWYYFKSDGAMATGWVQDNNKWFYLNNDGTMVTEWLKVGDSTYYYLKSDGSMATGWYQMDNSWYYFNPTGELIRGWTDIEGSRYLLGDDGKMYTGWQQIDGNWYYFGSNGKMRTGWQEIDKTWYFLDQNGRMLSGWQLIDGEYYYLHDGKMLTGWLSDSNGSKYYMSTNSGRMTRGWRKIDGSWFYFNQNGHMQTGWLNLSGKYYYLDPENGKMTENVSRVIDNVNYTFDNNGVCQNETNNMSGIADSYFNPDDLKNSASGSQSGQANNSSQAPSGSSGNSTSPSGSSGSSNSPSGTSGSSNSPSGSSGSSSGGPTGGNVTNAGSSSGNVTAPGSSSGSGSGSSNNNTSNNPGANPGGSSAPGSNNTSSGTGSNSSFAPGSSSGSGSSGGGLQPGLTTGPGR